MGQNVERLLEIVEGQPVIPVVVVDDVNQAISLARALVKGGLTAIEITLRTANALDAIKNIANDVPDAVVGAGTVLHAEHFAAAESAGAQFMVSPGLSGNLVDAADDSGIPLLPGAITPSELMAAIEEGYSHLKFFPAEQAGGMGYVKALSSPFSSLRFCPTGGVSANNAREWLQLPNVFCVGGSWVAPHQLIADGHWDKITELAKQTHHLKP